MAKTSELESGTFAADSDCHITYEDQQKINKFARCNARLEDIKDELKTKENDLQNLQDAEDEMMIALDADEKDEAQEAISQQRTVLEEEKSTLSGKASELQEIMTQLKADLYAKFGNNINLEADED
ncbi:Prefoldin subunit 4 [Armadillidium vulgare]|nr:Prefoldin subunit 4 [Armadillidium vulgare]